jgi:hypothetical protein
MATLREYFDTDAKVMTAHTNWLFSYKDGVQFDGVIAKVAFDFEANAKYWYLYVPDNVDLSEILIAIFQVPHLSLCELTAENAGVFVDMGLGDYSERHTTGTLQFTKRIHLYLEHELTNANRELLRGEALIKGYYLSIRDREYARKRSEYEKPLAFISHDSRDKDPFVRDLALELSKNFCPVWYDEYSLKVGDSLRASIEKGLKEARKCILILSPNFLANEGWGLAEYDSIFTREIIEKDNIILPVWLDVEVKDVYKYSPRLADKVGLSSKLGAKEIARRLVNVIKNGT